MEKNRQTLKLVDAIEWLEIMPLMYEPILSTNKELATKVVYSLENISYRNNQKIDFYTTCFPLLYKSELYYLALELLESRKHDETFWNNKGALQVKLGYYKEAIVSYDHALKFGDHPLYYVNKSRVFQVLRQYSESLAILNEALNLIQKGWFETNNSSVELNKTTQYMLFQNKLAVSYELYHSSSDSKELLKNNILECIDVLTNFEIVNFQHELLIKSFPDIKLELEGKKQEKTLNLNSIDQILRSCKTCHKIDSNEKPLFTCRYCKSVIYCSRECQKSNWVTHKEFCKRVIIIISQLQTKKHINLIHTEELKEENYSKNSINFAEFKNE